MIPYLDGDQDTKKLVYMSCLIVRLCDEIEQCRAEVPDLSWTEVGAALVGVNDAIRSRMLIENPSLSDESEVAR
jgi:hypothetical protein